MAWGIDALLGNEVLANVAGNTHAQIGGVFKSGDEAGFAA